MARKRPIGLVLLIGGIVFLIISVAADAIGGSPRVPANGRDGCRGDRGNRRSDPNAPKIVTTASIQ